MRQIKLNPKLCKGCGICVGLCPKEVFDTDIEGRPIAARMDACIGCKLCVLRCPDFALEMEE